jgi:multiple sugar transport system ATP-binding protein
MPKAKNRNNVILGIRAEDVTIAPPKKSHLSSKLYSLEPTGDLTLVTAYAGEQLVVAKAARNFRQEIDTPIGLNFATEHAYLFDGETGERIR